MTGWGATVKSLELVVKLAIDIGLKLFLKPDSCSYFTMVCIVKVRSRCKAKKVIKEWYNSK